MKKTVILNLILFLAIPTFAPAATRLVPSQYQTIQEAIDETIDGDVVIVAEGTYFENINFNGKNITLRSINPNDPDIVATTIIDGMQNGSVVTFNSGEDVNCVLSGFTITNGYSVGIGGGIHCSNSSPTITRCIVRDNKTTCYYVPGHSRWEGWFEGGGGGLYCNARNPTITNCEFISNSAAINGGGMYNLYSNPKLINCTFSRNFVTGVWGGGGGMHNRGSNPTLTNCIFTENSADDGGGMFNDWDSSPKLINCTFIENSSRGSGGILNDYSNPTLINCIFSGNSAEESGGGIGNYKSNLIITNCTFSGNSAGGWCGGMVNSYSSLIMTNCTFSRNSASMSYGGLYNGDGSSPTLINCILYGNSDSIGMNESAQIYNTNYAKDKLVINYCCVQGWTGDLGGTGNICTDPLFAKLSYWDQNGTPDDPDGDFLVDGDYHLKSQAGRYDLNTKTWVKDDVTSPCIDAGDPDSPIGYEPFPNGGIINMGAYGGTAEASKSYFGEPVCETIVAGDINGDCIVDFKDFAFMSFHWLVDNRQLPPGQASNPNPPDGATGIGRNGVILSWTAGAGATSHDVYFGTRSPGTFQGNQTATTFNAGNLATYEMYFWRIDELNTGGKTTSPAWKFTTQTPKTRCFPANTLVWADGGLVKISEVTPGQKIASAGTLGKAKSLGEVESVQEHEGTFKCYDIAFENGNCISVADNHYFLLDSDLWVSVQELTCGSRLQSFNGPIAIESVVKRAMPFVGKVYNLKVKGSDQYFVGNDGVVVRDY